MADKERFLELSESFYALATLSPEGDPFVIYEQIASSFRQLSVAPLKLANPSDGAGTAVGTLTNAPTTGNPINWVQVEIDGNIRYMPLWSKS